MLDKIDLDTRQLKISRPDCLVWCPKNPKNLQCGENTVKNVNSYELKK